MTTTKCIICDKFRCNSEGCVNCCTCTNPEPMNNEAWQTSTVRMLYAKPEPKVMNNEEKAVREFNDKWNERTQSYVRKQ